MSAAVICAIYIGFLVIILLYYRADSRKLLDMARRAHLTSLPAEPAGLD